LTEPVPEDTLGHRIRKVRHERGMSLSQVARDDFTRAFLNQIEMGRSQPSTRVLRVIANRLGTPTDYLLEGPSAPLLEHVVQLEQAVNLALAAFDRGDSEAARAALEAVRPAGAS
jgi:transcriptional regulator with XRE-family HTH domain